MTSDPHDVSLVVLAKELGVAKTRLGLDPERAQQVALRLVERTVRAALDAECSGVVSVVTSDPLISEQSARLGAVVVPEGRPWGMNRAGALGRERALRDRPLSPVAVMVADLPLLRPQDLDAAVLQFRQLGAPMYVPDHHLRGTTLLIHGPEHCPGLAFGRDSALMHRRLGYRSAPRAPRGLRVDLDTPEDAQDFLAGRWHVDAPTGSTDIQHVLADGPREGVPERARV